MHATDDAYRTAGKRRIKQIPVVDDVIAGMLACGSFPSSFGG